MRYSEKDQQRFRSKVNYSGNHPKGCHEWIGGCFDSGYGLIRVRGKNLRAHRVAWELANGEIPPKLMILHDCDNPKCVNPDHLFLGDNEANVKDMLKKGRQPKGIRNGRALLNPVKVSEIREKHANKECQPKQLADIYGVHLNTIYCVLNNETWKEQTNG